MFNSRNVRHQGGGGDVMAPHTSELIYYYYHGVDYLIARS